MESFTSRRWRDVRKGESKELKNKRFLESFYGELEKTGTFDHFDFKGKNCFVEFRTRTCFRSHYDTTMLPACKIDWAKKQEYPCFIVIQFTDDIYYWLVDKTMEFERKMGGRCDRNWNEYKNAYYYVPVNLFQKLSRD